jgi:hypothetical protein
LTVEAAELQVRQALADREHRFLEIARLEIYGRSDNPFAILLRHAGCVHGDLARSVREDGLDATLERLARDGVYLTDAEFKGKQEVVRGGLAFRADPAAFDPLGAVRGFVSASSGTSNAPVRSVSPLHWLERETPAAGVFLAAHGRLRHALATYEPLGPGNAGVEFLLTAARLGIAPERWFARTGSGRDPARAGVRSAHGSPARRRGTPVRAGLPAAHPGGSRRPEPDRPLGARARRRGPAVVHPHGCEQRRPDRAGGARARPVAPRGDVHLERRARH